MHPKYHGTSCRLYIRLQSGPSRAAAGTSHAKQDTEHWM